MLTDDDGRFILSGMPPGRAHLRVEQGGGLFEDLPELDVPNTSRKSGVDLGTVVLQRGSILEGVVFDASGEPVRAGSMTIRPVTKDGTEHGRTVYFQIGKDGRFRRTGLRSGSYQIQLFGHEGSEEIVELGVDETRQVEFHVPRKE